MKIGIIGFGYVGKAMYNFFLDKYDVIYYDNNPVISGSTKKEINNCDLGIICVPTPSTENGKCDTSIVEEVIDWLNTPLILIKSTIEIGTTQRLIEKTKKNIVFSPEYIGESDYDTGIYNFNKDMNKIGFFTFGGEKTITNKIVNIFQKIAGPNKKYIQTDSTTAEVAKYMENAYLSSKVTFCYEMAEICKNVGCNYNEVRELWLQDPRIGTSHTSVFFDSILPFSGKCLPKDLKALIYISEQNGYCPKYLKEILESNSRIGEIRQKEKLD
tara:strand:- start:565 stop:1377 length:813 start_codon:yes stop_codon:yes gene_type:complete